MSIWFNNNGTKRQATFMRGGPLTSSADYTEILLGLLNPYEDYDWSLPATYFRVPINANFQPSFKYVGTTSIPYYNRPFRSLTPAGQLTTNTVFTVLQSEYYYSHYIYHGNWAYISIGSNKYYIKFSFNLYDNQDNANTQRQTSDKRFPVSDYNPREYDIVTLSMNEQMQDLNDMLIAFYKMPADWIKGLVLKINTSYASTSSYAKAYNRTTRYFHSKLQNITSSIKLKSQADKHSSDVAGVTIANNDIVLVINYYDFLTISNETTDPDRVDYYYVQHLKSNKQGFIPVSNCSSPIYSDERNSYFYNYYYRNGQPSGYEGVGGDWRGSWFVQILNPIPYYSEPSLHSTLLGNIPKDTDSTKYHQTYDYFSDLSWLEIGGYGWIQYDLYHSNLNTTYFSPSRDGYDNDSSLYYESFVSAFLGDFKNQCYFTYSSKNKQINITCDGKSNKGTLNGENNYNGLHLKGQWGLLTKDNKLLQIGSNERLVNFFCDFLWKIKINNMRAQSNSNVSYQDSNTWVNLGWFLDNTYDDEHNISGYYPPGEYKNNQWQFQFGGVTGGSFSINSATKNGSACPIAIIMDLKYYNNDEQFRINNLYKYCFHPGDSWQQFCTKEKTVTYPLTKSYKLYNASNHFAVTDDNYITYNDDVFLSGSGPFYVYNSAGTAKVTASQKITANTNYIVKA